VRSFGFDEMDEAKWTILLRLLPTSKLLWLRERDPEVFNRIHTCLTSSWDFIHFRLCGRVAHWAESLENEREILDYFGIPPHWFGSSVETGQIIGYVDDRGSEESGLAVGTPVVMGGIDSLCMFLGSGMTEPEIALNASGTTDVVAVTVGQQPVANIGYPVQHLIPPLWLLSLSPVRGPTLAWFRDLLLPRDSTFADLDHMAAQAPPGSEGLLCLPYLSGEKGAIHDPGARGILIGLDLQHEKRHMARAVLEGIAFSTRQILEAYEVQGVRAKEVRLCGGGAKSRIWNQIKADIFNVPVKILQVLDTGCLGAAMLAAVAAGDYGDRKAACISMSNISSTILPDPQNVGMYRSAYEAYKQLYPLNRVLFSSLKDLRRDR
jgi:xylulokinase